MVKISKFFSKNQDSNSGFSLIEMIVAVAVFSIAISIPTGLFVSVIRSQEESLAEQETIDAVSYTIEYMSRSLRMAKKDLTGSCITQDANYENPDFTTSSIRFLNYAGACQEFALSDSRIVERKSPDEDKDNLPTTGFYLTSSGLKINPLVFRLLGEVQTDDFQPRVTIMMGIEGEETSFRNRVQTTVSQRNLDFMQ